MTSLEAAALLRQAMTLQVGDPLPQHRLNPNVVTIYHREDYATGSVYIASGQVVDCRTMEDIAQALGQALWIQDTIGEHQLGCAKAVLRGRMLDMAFVDWSYRGRLQVTPVNAETVNVAANLVNRALSIAL